MKLYTSLLRFASLEIKRIERYTASEADTEGTCEICDLRSR